MFKRQKQPEKPKKQKRKLTTAEKREIRRIMELARGDGKPHSAQDTLPFRQMYPDGLCKLDDTTWSRCIEFRDLQSRNERMFLVTFLLRIATQFLIYEIVCGLRDPSTFTLNSTNECGTAGNIFYNAGAASVTNLLPTTIRWCPTFRRQRKFPVSLPHPAGALLLSR